MRIASAKLICTGLDCNVCRKDIISFMESELEKTFLRASAVNRENLRTLLRDNSDTEYGRRYGFREIKDADDYRMKIPLSGYENFRPYIEKMRKGEEDQLTVYPVESFCRTSGTEGKAKYIPLTRAALERYGNTAEYYKDNIMRGSGGKRLLVSTFRTDISRPIEDSLILSEIYYRFLYEKGLFREDDFVGGRTLCFAPGAGDIFFAKVWAALLTEDIAIIESIFLYDQLYFFSYLEENWRYITDCMLRGGIPEDKRLSGQMRDMLLNMDRPEERMRIVRQELETGMDGIALRLWPKLRLISGISSRAFFAEDTALKRYTGDVPQHYLWYCASECFMGIPVAENDFRFVLLPKSAFFEFLPYEENAHEGEPRGTLLPEELKTGGIYEIVITNFSGLYRYCLGDIVKVADFYGEAPVIRFLFRKNQAINIAGEKMSISQIEKAMEQLSAEFPVDAYCFGASAEHIPGRYLAALSSGDMRKEAEPEISRRIDEMLKNVNHDYEDLRNMNYIRPLGAFIFSPGDYHRFMEYNGLTGGHNKPKHIAYAGFSEALMEGWNYER